MNYIYFKIQLLEAVKFLWISIPVGELFLLIFGKRLSEVESKLLSNINKTKKAFPEETSTMEFGLELMSYLTKLTQEAVNDFRTNPNYPANLNLFARNRQLLLNAYFCILGSSYGTQFVILRTVLENNNLMRLFNKDPRYAYEWFSNEFQNRFTIETQKKYGQSEKLNVTYKPSCVRKVVFEKGKEKVGLGIKEFYEQLCNYTHPNFIGWQELIGYMGKNEIIMNKPVFYWKNTYEAIGVTLYLMQLSFKTFVETFKNFVGPFTYQLKEWQDSYNELILRYKD